MRKEYDFSKGQRGPVLSSEGKTKVNIMLDEEVFSFFCAKAEALGRGYEGFINETLKTAMVEMRREAGGVGGDSRL